MEPIILGLVLSSVFGFTGWAVTRSRKEWAGYWRGRKVHVLQVPGSCTISIDGEVVAKKKKWHHLRIEDTYEDPLHGACPLQLVMIRDSNGGVSNCQLVIDGEIVHLIQAPSDFWGRSVPEKMPELKETSTVAGTTITDPRYAAASRLLEAIHAEVDDDKPTEDLIDSLHQELSEHILIAQRLMQSKADYAALGNDEGHMDEAQRVSESRIKKLLTALQDIHLAVVQRNISSAAPVLSEARKVIAQIHAETELEVSLSESDELRRAQQAQARKKKEL